MAISRHNKLTLKQFIILITVILLSIALLLILLPYANPKSERVLNDVESKTSINNPIYHHFLASGKEDSGLFPSKAAAWGDTSTSYYFMDDLSEQKFKGYLKRLRANGWKFEYLPDNSISVDRIDIAYDDNENKSCLLATDNTHLQLCITGLETPTKQALLRVTKRYETKVLERDYNLEIAVTDYSMFHR